MTLMSFLMQLFAYLFYLKQQIFLWKIPDDSIIFKKNQINHLFIKVGTKCVISLVIPERNLRTNFKS